MPRVDRASVVPAVAGVLIVLHVLLRLWTASGGWFLRQDFLAAAAAAGLPVDVPGPPGAAALARVMASVAPMSWPAFVILELVGQLAVDLLLYGLLVQLFGRRPAVLLPLAVYLASTLPLVGGLWWSAALVQLPLQLALLVAVTGHVRHLRTGGTGAMVASSLAVAIGLLFSPGMALVPLLLLVGTAMWGSLRRSRRVWPAQIAAVAAGLAARALTSAAPLVDATTLADNARDLPGTLLHTVLPGLVGGPGAWSPAVLPLVVPDPAGAVVLTAAVVVAAVVLVTVLVHRGALRAWLLAAAVTVVVLVSGVFSPTGADSGGLTADVVPPAVLALVAALALGLASLPVRGAPTVLAGAAGPPVASGCGCSARRPPPLWQRSPSSRSPPRRWSPRRPSASTGPPTRPGTSSTPRAPA